MSKEYLEAFNYIRNKFIDLFHEDNPDFDIVESALNRLESIDNAEPSEALECVESIEADLTGLPKHVTEYDECFDSYLEDIWDSIDTIKQALLKAQEPKQYLKWENLEKDRTYKVLLNGIQYELVKRYDDYEYRCDYITLQKKTGVSIFIYEYEKEIFNDLHLERVE